MPKFLVTATMTTDLYILIEAPDADTAHDIASNTDGSNFKECERGGDWQIGEASPSDSDEKPDNVTAYEIQHYTLCDGWVNTWRIVEDDGTETPHIFETEAEAKAELEEFFVDHFEAYDENGIEYDKEDERGQYVIVPIIEAR